MQQRTIGPFTVSAIGLGAMPVSMNNDNELPDRADAIGTVHAALDAGVTFIDTADIYAPSWDQMGHNERIVRDALASWDGDTSGILVGTKGGITRTAEKDFGRDGSLGYLRSAVQRSMENLGVEVIDFYQYHRPDRWMVYGEIMQNLKTLQDEGLVRALGISNASVEEIAIAEQVLGAGNLVSVQNQFSPRYPGSFGELRYCDAHGIAFLPWSPLGGTGGAGRTVGERFGVFREIGEAHSVSAQQVVLAWELSLSPRVVPIPGARRAASITDSARAADLVLDADELARCSAAVGLEL
ncbi:MAG: aldo/keto reductase [Microbacterium sp. 69-7]|uniref:aldo/keto reductase n=1 Tax=unclassified Microbacterium TaxID=2609290 RepID=UPI00044F9CA2|nr:MULTISPECIES: aldo/keto reductase [unclassified Microbacterium]EXJ52060.1 aldo/keto reductase [Microbacterium sp. MRS-1]OJU43153.1 MAG: aldo/keto reductase [Microbacterium sp. 69-7]